MKKDINKELLLQWKKLFIYNLFTYLLSIILILLNVITFIFFKKYFMLLTNINIVTLVIIIILNNLKTITIKIRNSTEEEINNLSKSELYYRHLILKKIIVCSNLENIFTEYLSVCEKLMKEKYNDESNDKTEKWNPAQEFLISYIKECELIVFEAEKVHDFIRNEIKAKRYKGGNT